jgi:nitroimidazol reductase NimA-like FMN-containing flavoprotein (pyridoxamine 5'-phosphate oxidase superfamily)
MIAVDPALLPNVYPDQRELLVAFEELVEAFETPSKGQQYLEPLNALVSLLRQVVPPFAFLDTEIDALETAVAASPDLRFEGGLREAIRRRLHRIGALLELHLRQAGSDGDAPAPLLGTDAIPAPEAAALGEMTRSDVEVFLRSQEWGLLCTLYDGRPYAVPVSYGFDGQHLYVASGPGMKHRALDSCSAVCFTVAQVGERGRWRSVVIRGEAHAVRDVRGRLHGMNVLRRQRSGPAPTAMEVVRAAAATLFRITPGEISGRMHG